MSGNAHMNGGQEQGERARGDSWSRRTSEHAGEVHDLNRVHAQAASACLTACPKPPCLAAVWLPFEAGGIKPELRYIAENCERSMRHVN